MPIFFQHTDPLVVILGPTAVGKTEIAIQVAECLNGEIISADSRLFYRGLDIGTAKPSLEEQARIPHHLVDIADPNETWSLAIFQRAAREAVADIQARGKLPFLVGGTGQYIQAVIQGWDIPAQEPDILLRGALERWADALGPYGLHQRLAVLDPHASGMVDARNVRRTIRAIEVILRTGRRFSEQRQRVSSPYSLLLVGLKRPRSELYRRVDERIEAMFAAGLIEEVRSLLGQGYAASLPTLSAIGYREITAYLRGLMTLEEAKTQMRRLTRRYIRQQANWFKESDPAIHWFTAGPNTAVEIEELIRSGQGWLEPGAPAPEQIDPNQQV